MCNQWHLVRFVHCYSWQSLWNKSNELSKCRQIIFHTIYTRWRRAITLEENSIFFMFSIGSFFQIFQLVVFFAAEWNAAEEIQRKVVMCTEICIRNKMKRNRDIWFYVSDANCSHNWKSLRFSVLGTRKNRRLYPKCWTKLVCVPIN